MKRWFKALFLPIAPPIDFSVTERDFEKEYKAMQEQYLKRQEQQKNVNSICEAKLNMPLAWTLR